MSDSQGGYRAFSRKALNELNFTSQGFSVEFEMQFLVREKDLVTDDYPDDMPWEFSGGEIKQVVSGEPYLDLEMEAIGMMKRD